MGSLDKRLARLEARTGGADRVNTILIVTGTHGAEAVVALLPGGGTISRERDESESDFIERVNRHVGDTCRVSTC